MNPIKISLTVLMTALLAGCAGSMTVKQDEMENVYRQLQGARLELRQALEVAPGRARVFIQHRPG